MLLGSALWFLLNHGDLVSSAIPPAEGIPGTNVEGEECWESITKRLRPGVITGRKLLDDLQEEFRKRNVKLPVVYCKSHEECKRILLLAHQHVEEGQKRSNIINDDRVRVILVVRCNFGTCAKYQGGNAYSPTKVAVEGAVAMAHFFHKEAFHYGVAVILQSETRCWERLTGWFDGGLLPACKEFYHIHGVPLFSSHIMELSSPAEYDTKEELSAISQRYQEELKSIDMKLDVIGLSC